MYFDNVDKTTQSENIKITFTYNLSLCKFKIYIIVKVELQDN